LAPVYWATKTPANSTTPMQKDRNTKLARPAGRAAAMEVSE